MITWGFKRLTMCGLNMALFLLTSCPAPQKPVAVNCVDSPKSESCPNSPTVLLKDLEKNYLFWKNQGIQSYFFKVSYYQSEFIYQDLVITVSKGKFQTAFDVQTQEFISTGIALEPFKTINIAFQTLHDSIQNDSYIGVVYDSLNVYRSLGILGIPMETTIKAIPKCQPESGLVCGYISWKITEFKALP